jgi:hypothetical protein
MQALDNKEEVKKSPRRKVPNGAKLDQKSDLAISPLTRRQSNALEIIEAMLSG